MKAEVSQQRSLLELAELDAELSRLNHRAAHLPEQQRFEEVQAEQHSANDRLAALNIALEDIDALLKPVPQAGLERLNRFHVPLDFLADP